MAGRFRSIAGPRTDDREALGRAIDEVFESYPTGRCGDEVLVQPLLGSVRMSAVAFTRDPATGAPYLIVNYDESGATDLVTSGRGSPRKWIRFEHPQTAAAAGPHGVIVDAVREIASLIGDVPLDIELAVDRDGRICIFQVRPLLTGTGGLAPSVLGDWLFKAQKKLEKLAAPHPLLAGRRSVFGVMPDWNPAEMIGVKPRPLAMSTYRELITNRVWAQMRSAYGYRDVTGFPLLVSILGVPFIDVRVSFNSFVPGSLEPAAADHLVNLYVDKLAGNPHLHDKVEFEIVVSCLYPGVDEKLGALVADGLSAHRATELRGALHELTKRIVSGELLRDEDERLLELAQRHDAIERSDLSIVARFFWLIEDCRSFGTLPFCGYARAGFVAMQILRGFVDQGVLSRERLAAYLASLSTVARELATDADGLRTGRLSRDAFVARYGHLRPGTYDILSRRYDEALDEYFLTAAPAGTASEALHFEWRATEQAAIEKWLREEDVGVGSAALFAFFKRAIEGRERAKLAFTRNISDAFVLLERLGSRFGISREQLAWLDLRTLLDLYGTLDAIDLKGILEQAIDANLRAYETTSMVRLPDLIREPTDVYQFHVDATRPNFVGVRRTAGDVVPPSRLHTADLAGAIVCLPSADPGYDWLFTRNIAGLVTTYGGANSHMAIRAAELGLPAVIGCGPANSERWFAAARLELDCQNQVVRVIV